ncbi:MAG TPA: hypothetical protein VEC96_08825, partial [Anaerolineae bacterium]|nr:hypothetical protein [Anaerolineae bacterium]
MIFGLGLGALLATVALMIALAMPTLSPHLDNLTYRARSYYRKLVPHPEYLPTPAPTAIVTLVTTDTLFQTTQPELTPTPTATPIPPTATPISPIAAPTEQTIAP